MADAVHRDGCHFVDHRCERLSQVSAWSAPFEVSLGGSNPVLIAAASRVTHRAARVRSQAKRATVLIVDDEPATTETFARMLKLEGYDVRTALDAETGLREAEVSHLDAILLDLRMPLVDGLAFLQRLRALEDHGQTPVAIVTGDYLLDETISNELRGLGAKVYFKPIWLEDLVRITQALVPVRH
jgi:CheY-like chemotaxis protein